MATTPSGAKGKAAAGGVAEGFTAEERAAIKERAQELRSTTRRARGAGKADQEGVVLAKIAELAEPERAMAERLHAVIMASAPELVPRLWYGMPAYAKGDKVLCFFQSAAKFTTRYATLGFSDQAQLDDGGMWPTAFALARLTDVEEERIAELVTRAVAGR